MLTSEKVYLEALTNLSKELYAQAEQAGMDLLIESVDSYTIRYDRNLVERDNRGKFSDLCLRHNQRIYDIIKNEIINYVGLTNHPKVENAWKMAYDNRHSEGYQAILEDMEELADLML